MEEAEAVAETLSAAEVPFFDAFEEFEEPSVVLSSTAAIPPPAAALRRRRSVPRVPRTQIAFEDPVAPDAASAVADLERPREVGEVDVPILINIADLISKAIAFQIGLLTLPISLSQFFLSLVVDPSGTLAGARDRALQWCAVAFAVLRDRVWPVVSDWALRQHRVGDVAIRLALGLFWSLFVGCVLFGCLLTAFFIGSLLMLRVVDEPLRIEDELIFDYTRESPVALVPVSSCKSLSSYFDADDVIGKSGRRRVIPLDHKLLLMISLTLPESDYNRKLGVFQVRADFLSSTGGIIASSSRPCMLQYKSSLVRFLQTLFKSGPLLAGYISESQILKITMKDFIEKTDPTACIRILIQPRAEFQRGTGIPEIYVASLVLESELPLFKRILWSWRRTIFIWISLGLFLNELVIILLCCRPLIIPRMTRRSAT